MTAVSACDSPSLTRLLIVTDAWAPQINGVARTYQWLQQALDGRVAVRLLTPDAFACLPLPTYPDIGLALARPKTLARMIEAADPDAVHIATEGPLGVLARRFCQRAGIRFTSCYHTRYPEYLARRALAPLALTYALLRRFHGAAARTMVATPDLAQELEARGFRRLVWWRRGVDVALFRDGPVASFDWPRPYFLYVGRLAVEKSVDDFLRLDLPGTKIVVGDGPERARLRRDHPQARFLGAQSGKRLASIYRTADVFVFPSRTDTYGLVMAEALAAGAPIAAYPGAGARAIMGDAACGVLSDDLRAAALAALGLSRDLCRSVGARHSLEASAESFLSIVRAAMSR